MLAGPTVPLPVMCRAVARTCNTLTVASIVDIDRSAEDREFFAAEAAKLLPLRHALLAKLREIEDHELGPGDQNQSAVVLGDQVLDRGVRAGNTRTKLGLKGKSGLGAEHAFGNRVDDLTDAPHRNEPALVREAITKIGDLPDYDDKAKVQNDLLARVELQEGLLKARDQGDAALSKLESEAVKLVVEAADKLVQAKAALDGRFPRQRGYVASFFLDVSRKRRSRRDDDDGEGSGGGSEG
ncbi:hypothetical protein [Polyangium spumosum]|uniref:Uncharacterized protein n=1 Tax=Polyangium spumosum TaxID=889282 RepID=A0A6N7PK82_9BACT|nr:hypothetical protein [Polyangium spumosum]MRG92217.1 hypothetical protein [Polyangium spumosum]